jgi:bifunctional non-homologous end joining protein LigD
MATRRKKKDALAAYRAKRRFRDTPEPRGRAGARAGRLYTIQKHAARRLHYDLRLELDGVLKSWAVTKGPSLDPGKKRLAVRTEDHPVAYARFEGRIPNGNYGAGTVLLWDQGSWEPIGDPHAGLEDGKLLFRLHGERLRGAWSLVRFHGKGSRKRENWLLIKQREDPARGDGDVTETETTSVASGRELDAIAAAPEAVWDGDAPSPPRRRQKAALPEFSPPALATLVETVPTGKDWLFEMKFDGYRALTAADGGCVRICTRNGNDWTKRFPAIARAAAALDADRVLLDGEIVATDRHGRSDFGALQRALGGDGGPLSYFVFDLLAQGGRSLRGAPLRERKQALHRLLAPAPRDGPLLYADHVAGDGRKMFRTLCAEGFEGVIAKRADRPYGAGRSQAWLKIKCRHEQEFVVIGWSPSAADRPFASILLAQKRAGRLRYAGRAGSGFSRADLTALAQQFRRLARGAPPDVAAVPAAVKRQARWLQPRLVAEIGFANFTRDGIVRQGRFVGLRQDQPAHAVTREEPMALETAQTETATEIAGVRLTHPDKLLYPAQHVSKRDVARYLAAAAERMLPHLANRPLSLVRCPDGAAGKCFFQRHAGAGLTEALHRVPIRDSRGETQDYLAIADVRGLLTAAQLGVLEFHIWGAHADNVERPDRLVFDLDPDPAIDFAAVIDAAQQVRSALDALGLASFALLSGGKGIHVVVPLVRGRNWPDVKRFSKGLAERFAAAAPERYVATMRKARRTGRIFIDHFRNDRSASAIAPYSPRARDGAAVAWPVGWDELPDIASAAEVSIATAMDRLAAPDPWPDYAATRQRLTNAALRAVAQDGG